MMTKTMLKYMTAITITYILCLTIIKGTDGAALSTSRHKRAVEEVDTLTYEACEAGNSFCNGHGMCYQGMDETKKKMCR